jgi:hypothetical protein
LCRVGPGCLSINPYALNPSHKATFFPLRRSGLESQSAKKPGRGPFLGLSEKWNCIIYQSLMKITLFCSDYFQVVEIPLVKFLLAPSGVSYELKWKHGGTCRSNLR